MLSKVLLVSLLAAVAVALPPPSIRDPRPKPNDVPCRESPSVIALNTPAPVPTVINLNNPGPFPHVINLNTPAPSPSVINLNARQLSSSLPPTSTFSFGGIVPSSPVPLSSATPASRTLPSAKVDDVVATTIGPDGVKTVLIISPTTVTVTAAGCSSTPAFNPSQAPVLPQVSSTIPPTIASTPSLIILNTPSPGFSFTSAPAANSTAV